METGALGLTTEQSRSIPILVRVWKSLDRRDRPLTSGSGQTLNKGLPVITTVFVRDNTRYEVEQFAYPLHGPPPDRQG